MMYTRVYEVEFLDRHKASLAANTISGNLFSQVNEEDHKFMIFYEIVDHRVDVTETMHQYAFIIKKWREETKVEYQRLEMMIQ